eukprot:CAMPEP_0168314844 /NCGR_PEP_ID=MMETSP0210-20121227/9588_1 /TAXON_ID=40633 /ORGANISM="Condylostoma magnum, Strain COL2" /LENGTH=31 /DNA_ID= /DNA_START= /DNA_END= /DNA_ORIENTATION=
MEEQVEEENLVGEKEEEELSVMENVILSLAS